MLSKYMREGARLRPQGFSDFFTTNGYDELFSCALGAFWEGKFGEVQRNLDLDVDFEQFLVSGENYPVYCPEDCGISQNILHTIAHLNDSHLWTREKIADWLESIGE